MDTNLQNRNRQKLLMNVTESDNDKCWPWQGQISNSGYGRIMLKTEEGNQMQSAHRASYQLFIGELDKNGIIRQTCGNRLCINPQHLQQVFE